VEDKIIDEKIAADYLGLAVQTLRNWRNQCKGPPYIKLGKAIRYRTGDLDEYTKNRRIDPTKQN
jgi:predicted DNA-binding transcriptional regulator AlpA